jgi:hypothetical protein
MSLPSSSLRSLSTSAASASTPTEETAARDKGTQKESSRQTRVSNTAATHALLTMTLDPGQNGAACS